MFDSLHHAREHLSLEQNLALLRWLTTGYGTDSRITNIVNTREIWIVFAVNPDGAEYDLTGSPYRAWRKNRQPNAGLDRDRHGHQPELRLPLGVLRRVVVIDVVGHLSRARAPSRRPRRGPSATSWPVAGSVAGSRSRRRSRSTRPASRSCGRTATPRPTSRGDMTTDDHAALVALGRQMAATNGYTAMQSSSLYVTDGDEIDWAYGHEHIFMYTFELYPSHSKVSSTARFYPPDEVIGPQTERNKDGDPDPDRGRRLSVRRDRQAPPNCGPLYDTFETYGGWIANPLGHRYRDRRGAGSEPTRQATAARPDGHVRVAGAGHRRRGRFVHATLRRRRRGDDRSVRADRACLRRPAR